ncbi:MAG: hypothetical protein HY290_09290, partial [Planctomycetia bacterium]|nr:hypothetical protein [Planctomycetia bacterium]
CAPLVVYGWIQFASQEPRSEHAAVTPAASAAASRKAITVETSDFQEDSAASGMILPVSASESADLTNSSTNGSAPGADRPDDPDSRYVAVALGEWKDEYQGKRHLTVARDGTGTMVIDLDGIGKRLFAARMTFNLEWSIADGKITMKTLGGEPKSKVQLVLKLYGNEAEYKILELTPERMLLLDADGKTQYDWRRPNSSGEGAK